jgi:hypothetical protein
MKEKKAPKTIATINFKGGVGKTTCTWCLGDLLSTFGQSNVLLFDLDAQMSLTQAITLNEDGSLFPRFQTWAERSYQKKKTIFHAIEAYTDGGGKFDFGINNDFVYQMVNQRPGLRLRTVRLPAFFHAVVVFRAVGLRYDSYSHQSRFLRGERCAPHFEHAADAN